MLLAVAPASRGHGVGARLLRDAESRARAAGAARLLLEAHGDNAPALALYGRHGYARVGRRAGYYAHPPGDAVLFEKILPDGEQNIC
jgi:ribosomal-protein-alanine N-acetyltransferase